MAQLLLPGWKHLPKAAHSVTVLIYVMLDWKLHEGRTMSALFPSVCSEPNTFPRMNVTQELDRNNQ